MPGPTLLRLTLAALLAGGGSVLAARQPAGRSIVLDHARLVDGTGAAPIDDGRILITADRIAAVGPAAAVRVPAGADLIDLAGRTILPGLIDLHFHIETDPAMALRQLSHGVTSFRDPGQWNDRFAPLRAMIAADGLPGPRIFTTGPHIDGEHPAYPADAVVARDPEEARRFAERAIGEGASALKIYFRLPFASARAVIGVCDAHGMPCTAHLEILNARELLDSGLQGIEHITSFGTSLIPERDAEAYRQAVLADNDARKEGRYRVFAAADLDGPEARALYAVLRARRPWIDPTLAVFERRAGVLTDGVTAETGAVMAAGFAKMKQLTRRVAAEGGRLVMGGHTEVPFAARGEAPWRELELLVESGLSPLEAITAATGTASGFLYRQRELGTLRPGLKADLIVVRGDPSRDISAIRGVERVMVDGRWIDVARYRTR